MLSFRFRHDVEAAVWCRLRPAPSNLATMTTLALPLGLTEARDQLPKYAVVELSESSGRNIENAQ